MLIKYLFSFFIVQLPDRMEVILDVKIVIFVSSVILTDVSSIVVGGLHLYFTLHIN